MGTVTNLAEWRSNKAVADMQRRAKDLGINLNDWTVPSPGPHYVTVDGFKELYGEPNIAVNNKYYKLPEPPTTPRPKPLTQVDCELLVNEAIISFYERAMPARMSREQFHALWPTFIQMKDEFERKSLEVIDLYFLYKEMGCRPGEALALGETRAYLTKLGDQLKDYWTPYY
ncbi:hypothetical protein D3C81_190620 [compost metagenome]